MIIKNVKIENVLSDVAIEGNKISLIAKSIAGGIGEAVLDGGGATLLPAFIDVHTHLREPGYEYKEDIASGTKAAVAGGYSAVCPMPNTNPVTDNAIIVNYIINKSKEIGLAKVYPVGAITKGLKSEELAEMGGMKSAGAIAFSDDGAPVTTARMMRVGMEYAKGLGTLVMSHCEDKSLSGGYVNEGANATKAGLKGISRVAEELMVAREILLADSLNARVHICHISTTNAVDLVRWAKKKGIQVTCETCPHYIAATDDMILNYDTNAKVNPPLREECDRQSIIDGLLDGTIDCISTDHAPHHISEKDVEFDKAANGISGLESAFSLCYTELVKSGIMTLNRLSELMSVNPSRITGIPMGEIKVGGLADLVLVDENELYQIDSSKWFSKGRNTPFNGKTVNGKVIATIIEGKTVYCNNKIIGE